MTFYEKSDGDGCVFSRSTLFEIESRDFPFSSFWFIYFDEGEQHAFAMRGLFYSVVHV